MTFAVIFLYVKVQQQILCAAANNGIDNTVGID